MKLGIFGAGQLARMLALSAHPLGINIYCVGNDGDCAGDVATIVSVDMTDPTAIQNFIDSVDTVTFETENLNLSTLHALCAENPDCAKKLHPPLPCLSIGQDRLNEKQFFANNGIPTAPYYAINSLADLTTALADLKTSAILKTCQGGYDGKGQYMIKSPEQAQTAWDELGDKTPLILEGFVDFAFEVSIIAVRGKNGDKCYYPLTQNKHTDGILRRSTVPSQATNLQQTAEKMVADVMDSLDYVGVLAIEFFVTTDQTGTPTTLIANEMAPRVHNSGHWTMDGATTGQFENHIRAVLNLPLGSTEYTPTIMLNCIGKMPKIKDLLTPKKAKPHTYKKQPREGRKVGHINITGDDRETQADKLEQLL